MRGVLHSVLGGVSSARGVESANQAGGESAGCTVTLEGAAGSCSCAESGQQLPSNLKVYAAVPDKLLVHPAVKAGSIPGVHTPMWCINSAKTVRPGSIHTEMKLLTDALYRARLCQM